MTAAVGRDLEAFERRFHDVLASGSETMLPFLDFVFSKRGKRSRPILFFLCRRLFPRPPDEDDHRMAVAIELLHTASLVHDDVVDHSPFRRGKETLNARFGDRIPVLLGDFLMVRVLEIAGNVTSVSAVPILVRTVDRMVQGELLQALNQTPAALTPTLTSAMYLRIIGEKTSSLFETACDLAGQAGGADEAVQKKLRRFGHILGLAFQIRDDILDVSGDPRHLGKPVGQDFLNHKPTLPFLLALEGIPESERSDAMALARDPGATARFVEWIRQCRGIERSQDRIERLSGEALELLDGFEPSEIRDSLVRLVKQNTERVR